MKREGSVPSAPKPDFLSIPYSFHMKREGPGPEAPKPEFLLIPHSFHTAVWREKDLDQELSSQVSCQFLVNFIWKEKDLDQELPSQMSYQFLINSLLIPWFLWTKSFATTPCPLGILAELFGQQGMKQDRAMKISAVMPTGDLDGTSCNAFTLPTKKEGLVVLARIRPQIDKLVHEFNPHPRKQNWGLQIRRMFSSAILISNMSWIRI